MVSNWKKDLNELIALASPINLTASPLTTILSFGKKYVLTLIYFLEHQKAQSGRKRLYQSNFRCSTI